MKLKIQIQEIDFGDVILKAMSASREKMPINGRANSKIISVVTQLPSEVIRTVLDAVPQKDKCEIAALLVQENAFGIRAALSRQLERFGVEASVDEVSLSNEMEVSVAVSNLNYEALAETYLPFIREGIVLHENPSLAILETLLKLPGKLLYSALAKIPQNKKDEAVVYLINRYQATIISKLEAVLASQDIRITLGELHVEA